MQLKTRVLFILVCVMTFGTMIALAQTSPAVIPVTSAGNNGGALNGIAATTTELLFTQPFCAGQQLRGTYQEDLVSGTATFVSSIPETGICAENYNTISLGLGGFTAGDTFATGVSTTNTANEAVYKNGANTFIDSLPSSKNHAGIGFDTSGTFGFNLLVALENSLNGYDSTGAATFTYPTPGPFILEGAAVAPLTYAPCPGCLFATAVPPDVVNGPPLGNGLIFFVKPGTPSGTNMSLFSLTPGSEPEGLVFVDKTSLSCTLPGANGAAYNYFVSRYADASQIDNLHSTTGAVLAFTPAQLAPYLGQILVPDEGGVISAFSGPGQSTVFSNTGFQLEGSTIISCTGNGCPATFGFWKHHPFPAAMFSGGTTSIGCKNYNAATLLSILNSSASGGNAVIILGHQLIAALANYDSGGQQTPAASGAIGAAITLLCTNNIDLSTDFVAASSALGQQMVALSNILDAYNSSSPSCEGSNLSAVRPAPKGDIVASLARH
jgi:hypothetical protein